VRTYIEFAFDIIESFGKKAFVIIDEYDHFANDLIAQGTNMSEQQYKEVIWANGVVRDFYETLKYNSETVIEKIFITGITPIMLDDVTSGFNISNNLSVDVQYNEILGFTGDDVKFVISEAGIKTSLITDDIEYLYNGYKFHVDAKNKLYNSTMINYFFLELLDGNGKIKYLVDDNLKTDYSRIKMLLNKPENVENLETIVETGMYPTKVINRFSIEKIHEPKNFLSLLYYMGLVTIDSDAVLRIPNYSIKMLYWEYMENIITEQNPSMSFDTSIIYNGLRLMAFDGDYEKFFKDFHNNFISNLSNIDLENLSEKNIKFLMLSIFFQTNYYLPISETENSKGYTDIYLQRRDYIYPKITTDWVLELKYVKQSDVKKKTVIEAKKKEALEQIERYKTSNLFKDRTDVRYLMIIFIGKKKYLIEEI
jgi:hypothetical protein